HLAAGRRRVMEGLRAIRVPPSGRGGRGQVRRPVPRGGQFVSRSRARASSLPCGSGPDSLMFVGELRGRIQREAGMGDATYIHGTDAREQERLAKLGELTDEPFVRFL